MQSPFQARKYTALLNGVRSPLALLSAVLLLTWCVGVLGRGYWTPDEPREADIAWRMSWQTAKAVPLLAGEAFCEKPPLMYWIAAVPIRLFGKDAWAARLPNLLYALLTALAVGTLARRSVGPGAGLVGAAAISTLLLSYQVAIWLATDAPLLASVSTALLGAHQGFYATSRRERLRGYLLMHTALGLGFLTKSAAAWLVPAMAIGVLVIWEKRWRELLRWELYAGLLIQAAMILVWIWFVYMGPDGAAHLKVFFWNNLIGRFTHIDAPAGLQYAAAHRNSPGKYLLELPLYLFPWTLLVIAAGRRAWQQRGLSIDGYRPVRFALAAFLPSLALLSAAATARNIYLAPALPGVALLLAWWTHETLSKRDRWDVLAVRGTAVLLLVGGVVSIAVLIIVGVDGWSTMTAHLSFVLISALGLTAGVFFAMRAWSAAPGPPQRAQWCLLLAYCALVVGPASQIYRRVDAWQDLPAIARAIDADAAGRPLLLVAPDETTRAMIDMYARTDVQLIPGPLDAGAVRRVAEASAAAPQTLIVAQVPVRPTFGEQWLAPRPNNTADPLPWTDAARLRVADTYSLPNGRRYVLLERQP